ncbi:hypothetical protein C882_1917 [Caenispirillum salinarum AK4]|uniref:Uncharacterized protein n=1 Tax=Caenispirillum salinarum AK4 TaxID=1238182 RepID=K9H8P7_9PROT|nr:hypothetical protein C882_1917 [Caenispirillum salinarum AK4]
MPPKANREAPSPNRGRMLPCKAQHASHPATVRGRDIMGAFSRDGVRISAGRPWRPSPDR